MEYPTYLIHYGIPGQKWGERKYQNEDGTWTEEGLERRRTGRERIEKDNVKTRTKNYIKTINSLSDKEFQLFTGDPSKSKKQDIELMKRNIKLQPNYRDSLTIVSKHGNVTLAWLNKNYSNFGLNGQWEIGWATDPKARGTGVTQANIKEAIKLIREQGNVPISALIDPENVASIKTAEKAGFKEIGEVYNPNERKINKKYVYR